MVRLLGSGGEHVPEQNKNFTSPQGLALSWNNDGTVKTGLDDALASPAQIQLYCPKPFAAKLSYTSTTMLLVDRFDIKLSWHTQI